MINFSNGQVLQLDEFLDFYKTVDISAENYDSEKSIGLYTGMVIPTECTMLKFRYYTPDGTLIEQENVPLVYEGNSVDHIITKYLLTNKSSGVDYDTEGWTEELQTPSKDVRFVYTYEISVYTNGAEIKTNIVLTSVYGEQGERGSIYLGCYAKNSDVISAYTARGIVSDDYYLNKTNGKIYVCSRNGDLITWTPVAYGDSAAVNKMYSNAVNDALGSGLEGATDIVQALTVWTKNLVASSAFINELVSNNAFIENLTTSESFAEKLTANDAFIENLMSNNLTVGNAIQSSNYVEGTSGFKLSRDGTINANSGRFSSYIGNETIIGGRYGSLENISYRIKGLVGYLTFICESHIDMSAEDSGIYFPIKVLSTSYKFIYAYNPNSEVYPPYEPMELILSDNTDLKINLNNDGSVSSTINMNDNTTYKRIRIIETVFSS